MKDLIIACVTLAIGFYIGYITAVSVLRNRFKKHGEL